MEFIEWIGYVASFIILVSLLMRSLKRLRIINLIGALIFAVYGYLISAPPVMVMNLGIVFVNVYYLRQIYTSKEYFKIISLSLVGEYVRSLIDFHRKDIEKFMPLPEDALDESTFRFLIVRNMVPAGIFAAKPFDDTTLEVTLDYAMRPYQDFKTGQYIYQSQRHRFLNEGYERLIAFVHSTVHEKYLKRMGFSETTLDDGRPAYIKNV